MGPRACLDVTAKRKNPYVCRISKSGCPARGSVNSLTELSLFSYINNRKRNKQLIVTQLFHYICFLVYIMMLFQLQKLYLVCRKPIAAAQSLLTQGLTLVRSQGRILFGRPDRHVYVPTYLHTRLPTYLPT